jgi:hypothetical protein
VVFKKQELGSVVCWISMWIQQSSEQFAKFDLTADFEHPAMLPLEQSSLGSPV